MYFHAQNLNEKPDGKTGSMLRHGRCWLRFSEPYCGPELRLEWNIPTSHWHLGIEFGDEDNIQYSLACGLFAVWFAIGGLRWKWLPSDRKCEVTFHHRALWINLWTRRWEWSRTAPWWRRGLVIHFDDLLLGKARYTKETLSTHDALIPMPEGCYPATVKVERQTWKRPRWFARTRMSCWVEIPGGIPFEGKGTSSWNCGEDGMWGCGSTGPSVEEAIGRAVASVLESRRRYGGRHKHRGLEPVLARQVNGAAEPPPQAA